MVRHWRVGLGLSLSLSLFGLACSDIPPGGGGDPVKPVLVPPNVGRVRIEPATISRSEVVRVALKEPEALPATQIDTFKQSDGILDIIWIIDNSGSMVDNRTLLASNFQDFFNQLVASQTDFRIGVISTDGNPQPPDGTIPGQLHGTPSFIDKNTPNAAQAFAQNVVFAPGRVRWTQDFAMMEEFLTNPGLNSGFLRPNAALAVITLSNGDDESFGTVGHYARFLRGIKGPGNENWVSFSTISGDVPNGCQPGRDANFWGTFADPATRLNDMTLRLGGVVGSICDNSFEDTLSRISEALNTLRKAFPLSLKPDPGTITVLVTAAGQSGGVVIPNDPTLGWTYSATLNAIQFLGSYVPPPGSLIQIQYAITT